uniref:hypothetical protein n=1 Tax=Serratia quinivorans TaxID=137545 RepID=UPI0035C73264
MVESWKKRHFSITRNDDSYWRCSVTGAIKILRNVSQADPVEITTAMALCHNPGQLRSQDDETTRALAGRDAAAGEIIAARCE